MQDVIDFSNAKIYYPEEPKNISASVEHISLTAEQAMAQGWHFRYKSGKRVRITRFSGTAADIIVPSEIDSYTVNEIGERCFAQTAVKTVNIPSTVKKLGRRCFYLCAQLEQAVIEDGLSDLTDETFSNCEKLRTVILPTTLKRIGVSAFSFCRALEFIEIPLMCRTIGQSAFFYSGLRSFAMYEPYARFSDIDGTALDMTRIFYDYELVICRCTFPDELFVMAVGRNTERKPIRFPEGSLVMLGNKSVVKNWCLLDLSACGRGDVSRKPFGEDVHFYYNSVLVDFPLNNMPPTFPARVGSNFFDVKGYHTDANCGIDEVVTRENVQLVRHCIGMNSITFRSIWTCESEPVEVLSPNCYDIHEFTWEESGQTYHKFNTPFEILHDKDSVYHLQLKAFVIRKDKQTGQSIFYDRSVIDSLFLCVKSFSFITPGGYDPSFGRIENSFRIAKRRIRFGTDQKFVVRISDPANTFDQPATYGPIAVMVQ